MTDRPHQHNIGQVGRLFQELSRARHQGEGLDTSLAALTTALTALTTRVTDLEAAALIPHISIVSLTQPSGDNTVQTAFSGGGVVLATYTYTPPAEWDTYQLYAVGRANMNPATPASTDARIFLRIDGTDSSAIRTVEANQTGLVVTGVQGGCSDTTPVQLRGSRESATDNWTASNLQILMFGERV